MAELKTGLTGASVSAFIKAIPDATVSKDAAVLSKMLNEATGAKAEMWGRAIVGFGRTPYVGSDKKENDSMTMRSSMAAVCTSRSSRTSICRR